MLNRPPRVNAGTITMKAHCKQFLYIHVCIIHSVQQENVCRINADESNRAIRYILKETSTSTCCEHVSPAAGTC